ncbi:MAG TPA: DUF6596 domain-containing protein [Xanthobacteraceae bacterium]|jgi:hypothetical protein|nr:DUF6596 domain-containing protein [Xanthobacteraceae bacterium]
MSEFTLLFRGRDRSASPDQMQKTMQKWVAWLKELNEKGHIKYPGHPLDDAGKVVSSKQKSVHDGPYAEASELCREAMRLGAALMEHRLGATPTTHALCALMCLTAARLPARIDASGKLRSLAEQDRSLWDSPACHVLRSVCHQWPSGWGAGLRRRSGHSLCPHHRSRSSGGPDRRGPPPSIA